MNIYEVHINPALKGSLAIWRFEGSDAIEICDGITFDFYTGLPEMYFLLDTCNVHVHVHVIY